MSTFSPKLNSSDSRPKATKRRATPRTKTSTQASVPAAKAGVASARQASGARAGATRGTVKAAGREVSGRNVVLSRIRIAVVACILVVLVAVLGFFVLSHLPVFVIEGISAESTEHIEAATIAKLAAIDEGTTLLSVDVAEVEANLKKNPWVKSVSIQREFPNTLAVSIEERQIAALVVLGSGTSVWALGDDGVWIEPVTIDNSEGDIVAAALTRAEELGCLLVASAPSTVDPAQASAASDEEILAVLTYQAELPETISSEAQVYYAASAGSISLILKSGLEISLGEASDIAAKSLALQEIMATYEGQLTYINVRVPSQPSYRKVADGTTLTSSADEVVAQKTE